MYRLRGKLILFERGAKAKRRVGAALMTLYGQSGPDWTFYKKKKFLKENPINTR